MNKNVNETISRMKTMMNYGLKTENKEYSNVEYSKEAADGKIYGIVREGAKYYIKVSNGNKNLIKENFEYIDGFVNRKKNEYSSYANALKNFDLKMMGLKEAYMGGKNIIIESWNPDKQQMLAEEATKNMRKEIMRQRQIMENASHIQECGCCKGGDPFCEKPKCEDMEGGCCAEKNNVKKEFEVNADSKQKQVKESAEPLAWHKDGGDAKQNIADTYMDKSHGTEIGSSAPFDKALNTNGNQAEAGVVEEEAEDWGSKGLPSTLGVGEADTAHNDNPFNKEKGRQLDETTELDSEYMGEDDDEPMYDEEEPMSEEDGFEDDFEEAPAEDDVDLNSEDNFEDDVEGEDNFAEDEAEPEYDLEMEDDDVESRLSSIEDTLSTILDKLSSLESDEFDEEDDLWGDEEEDELEDEPMGDEAEEPMDDEEETQIYESRSYRKMRLAEENRLNDFGKHPAYQKKVMSLPQTGSDNTPHGRDWNDASVHSEAPYGQKIGSGAPFEVDPQDIENSIAECVKRILGKSRRK